MKNGKRFPGQPFRGNLPPIPSRLHMYYVKNMSADKAYSYYNEEWKSNSCSRDEEHGYIHN